MGQRRIRRPFSLPEVESLVDAVEQLGTGRFVPSCSLYWHEFIAANMFSCWHLGLFCSGGETLKCSRLTILIIGLMLTLR
jgi:hypothetical protein